MKRIILTCWVLFMAGYLFAQDNPLWLRYPAISPDGRHIVFSYQGDLWKVPADGGVAVPLTMHESHDYMPVWSHDGRQIAFASDRYGNMDVFVMPSEGGEARRLTYHSRNDYPFDFSPDNSQVLFGAARTDWATNAQFPSPGMSELYQVSVKGGQSRMLSSLPAWHARFDGSGRRVIYHDWKGYEDDWRKHHTSAVTRDVWMLDLGTMKYSQLSGFQGEDREPVFHSNGSDYFFLSEAGGSFNVYQATVGGTASPKAITSFKKHPVRFLSASNDNTLCYTYDGEIYTMKPGASPKKVPVRMQIDGRANLEKIVPVNGGLTEMTVSPNGKEIAFVVRGEIFVSSVEGGMTKRITNTPWQERMVSFSPDGRSLVYAAERDNNWNVYTKSIQRKEELYFFASTVLKEETVVASEKEEFEPQYSPDGKEIAYLEERTSIRVINLASKQVRTILPNGINYSYSDGDQYFKWSPDGQWIFTDFNTGMGWVRDVAMLPADGKGERRNLTQSGYFEAGGTMASDGSAVWFVSTRESPKTENGGPTMGDIYAVFLTREAHDRFRLNKDEYALWKEMEEKKKKENKDTAGKANGNKIFPIEWEGLKWRKERLTLHTADINAAEWNAEKGKLFYIANYGQGQELWSVDTRTRESKLLGKLESPAGALQMSKDGKYLFVLAGGRVARIDAESGKRDNVTINGEMVYNAAGEREYIFDHAWRQVKKKFYVTDLHDVDWESYFRDYRKFLPYIRNNYDFAEMLSEMLGELNASHTGCRYNASQPNTDATASLGLLMDMTYKGQGVQVAEVLKNGPLDKASYALKAGHVITAIDGEKVEGMEDYFRLLNRKAGKLVLVTYADAGGKALGEELVKPTGLGEENELLYRRWVDLRRKEVHELSGGKLGYVHVRGMNDPSMRVVVEEALGMEREKQGLVVDTRFNGGGNLHEQLSDFLSGKKYFDIIPHGQEYGEQPLFKWNKPSIVVMSESNYSDAHLFPVAYKIKGIGKTVGMPVPGTGTFVWWEQQIDPTLVFGIPQGGWRTPDGKFCENTQLEPDIRVPHDPSKLLTGKDLQLEAAVKELLKK